MFILAEISRDCQILLYCKKNMAGAVFANVLMEGVSPLFRDNIYSYARSLARLSGFARQVRINGRSIQEDDDERVHDIVSVGVDYSETTCAAQFSILNK